jgi:hypothetical protein
MTYRPVTAQEGGGSSQVPSLLAERARSECVRSMRAVEGSLGRSLEDSGCAGEDVANSGGLIRAILETTYASKLGRIIYLLNHGPADVRSSVDWLDPIHGGGVMLIRIRCRDKPAWQGVNN